MRNHTKPSLLFFVLAFFTVQINAQQHQLVKIWETDTLLKVPESVLYDEGNQVLYVANIDGTDPWAKDGKGSIGKVNLYGKIIAAEWVGGLHSPKGMALHKNKLYAADIDNLVVIDVTAGKIVETIKIEGASGLNDVTATSDGVIYVTDSRAKRLYRVENGISAVYLDSLNLKGPNGVLIDKDELYVLDAGGMYKIGKDKSKTMVTDGMEGGTDGIENVSGKDYIVSCWGGVIYYVNGDGTKEKLLDTREGKINSADIGYDAKNKLVYVPTFWKNSVVAYQLK